jgi:hypothetical protein
MAWSKTRVTHPDISQKVARPRGAGPICVNPYSAMPASKGDRVNSIIPAALRPAIPVIPPSPAAPDYAWLACWYHRDFLELGAYDTAPRTARGVIRDRLAAWGLDHFTDVAELVATELITNSVGATRQSCWEAGMPPVRLWLLGSGMGVAVLVWDGVPREPVQRAAADDDEGGRGLSIVQALSARWDFYFPSEPFRGKVTRAFIS